MSYLRLTPTRRALLLDVNAGDVVQGPDESGWVWAWRIQPPFKPRRVEAQMHQMRRAGWVRLNGQTWALTAEGRDVLDAS